MFGSQCLQLADLILNIVSGSRKKRKEIANMACVICVGSRMAGVRNQSTRGDMQELGLLGQQKQILTILY